MRHRVDGRKFSRTPAHRKAMFKNMAINLLRHERIKTTVAKAKELRRLIDKLITLGKKGDLHSIRQARVYIEDRDLLKKLTTEFKERFSKRKGGYTRTYRLSERLGDAAQMVLIEIIPDVKAKAKKDDKDKKKKKEAPKDKAVEPKLAKETKKPEVVKEPTPPEKTA